MAYLGFKPAAVTDGEVSLDGLTDVTISSPTTDQVLKYNGSVWVNSAAAASGGFPAGTLMLFQQTSAPTGWTKQTTHDNKALRVVSGTASSGGTTAFSTVFANQTPTITTSGLSAGATTLSTTQMPSHVHSGFVTNAAPYQNLNGAYYSGNENVGYVNTGSTGGGGSHTHSISGSATSSAITLNVQYVDLIIASKD
jgi:hypothetical protein